MQLLHDILTLVNQCKVSSHERFVYRSTANFTVYNCRSSAQWKEDMALSVTYSHHDRSTKAVLYGCTDSIRDRMIHRLKSCNYVVYHPLAIPTLFCDIERDRHFRILKPLLRKFVEKALNIANPQHLASHSMTPAHENSTASNHGTDPNEESEDIMKLWLQVSDLKRGLETWLRQLENLISHCEDIGAGQLLPSSEEAEDLDKRQYSDAGNHIKRRLLELKFEYDEKIRQCADIIDGMELAAQLVRGSSSSPSCFLAFVVDIHGCFRANHGYVLGVEHYWTGRHTDQSQHLQYQHSHCQSNSGGFQADAINIHAHDGVPTSHIRCGKSRISPC